VPLPDDSPPPYGTIVFDCDSTLSRIEGIEELAREHRAEVEELTRRAMDGEVSLEEVYRRRLEWIRPGRREVEALARRYAEEAVPHAAELVAGLQALGKRVLVVSGGLLPAVLRFARELGVEGADAVSAVEVFFDESGGYAGFDERSPLARGGGKIVVLEAIAAEPGAGAVAFVGDGITDLEAAGCTARFIAYGGVVRRAKVFEGARVSSDALDFAALVPRLLSEGERKELAAIEEHAALLEAAVPYLSWLPNH